MKKLAVIIKGFGFRGERKSFKHIINVPHYHIIPEQVIPGLKHPMPATSIETQEDAYIDEHYHELIWLPADKKGFWQVGNYKRVIAKDKPIVYTLTRKNLPKKIGGLKKADDVLTLAIAKGIKGQQAKDFLAVMVVMWPEIQDLEAEKIVNIVLAAMVVGLQTAVTTMKDALNTKPKELA